MKRLWVDANVLLRFLTGEPKDLADKAARLLARAEKGEIVLVVFPLVLAEVVWVLKSFYRHSLEDIAGALVPLISADGIEIEDRESWIQAIELARDKKRRLRGHGAGDSGGSPRRAGLFVRRRLQAAAGRMDEAELSRSSDPPPFLRPAGQSGSEGFDETFRFRPECHRRKCFHEPEILLAPHISRGEEATPEGYPVTAVFGEEGVSPR